jgi:hypothetical protein
MGPFGFVILNANFGCPILAAYLFLRLGWVRKEPLYTIRRAALNNLQTCCLGDLGKQEFKRSRHQLYLVWSH